MQEPVYRHKLSCWKVLAPRIFDRLGRRVVECVGLIIGRFTIFLSGGWQLNYVTVYFD